MNRLSDTWFIDGMVDFEYKKYVLLAYLQNVSNSFIKNQLYPSLSELIYQYDNLKTFLSKKGHIKESFPKEVSGLDLNKFKLLYSDVLSDDELMEEIENIVTYAMPEIQKHVKEGMEIYDFVEDQINLEAVGLISLNSGEGYILINNGASKETMVYYYQVTLIEGYHEKYRSLRTQFVRNYERNYINNLNHIKTELLKAYREYPNPATFSIESTIELPVQETLLPIGKRMLIRYLTEKTAI